MDEKENLENVSEQNISLNNDIDANSGSDKSEEV